MRFEFTESGMRREERFVTHSSVFRGIERPSRSENDRIELAHQSEGRSAIVREIERQGDSFSWERQHARRLEVSERFEHR